MKERVEASLVERARAGDHLSFEELLAPSVVPATRLAFGLLQNRWAAEDAFQEASVRAWRRLGNLRPEKPFQPWFLGIVANQCREIRRDRWWQLLRVADLFPPRRIQVLSTDAWLEGEDLRRAVARLPHKERAAILLHFYLDLPLADAASALGISVAGTKTRINRALRRLRPQLQMSEAKVPNV